MTEIEFKSAEQLEAELAGDGYDDGFPMVHPKEPEIPPRQLQLYDDFVREYLQDFNWIQATLRIGYPSNIAADYAQKFKTTPYILRRIEEAKRAQPHSENVEDNYRQQVINALLRESQYSGPGSSHGARVGALSKLSSILAMDAPTKTETTVEHTGGTTVEHSIAYDDLDTKDLGMIRELLTKQAAKQREQEEAAIKDAATNGAN